MAKAKSNERGKDRSYPCPRCGEEHFSVTTYLGVIASRPLMSWMASNGVAKLNVLADEVKKAYPNTFQPVFEKARLQWEGEKDTQFWKSAKQIGQDAADIGTLVHSWIEAHINGKEISMESLPPQGQAAVRGFLEWENSNKVKYLETEKTLYHCAMDYAGTCDCIAEVNGQLTMIDWKSSKGLYPNYVIQNWLYCIASEATDGSRLFGQAIIGRFGKDGSWEAPIFKRNDPIGIELAREVITGCRSIFKLNQTWDKLFPYVPKQKEKANATA